MRAGTGTGSLINHLMSRAGTPEQITEGMGATMLCWTDRHAATVTRVVRATVIEVVQDEATRTDSNGMSESQEYAYAPGKGKPTVYTLRKNGAWVRQGESLKNGARVILGRREEYHDFSF